MKRLISMAVIRRLPKYHRYLTDLMDEGVERISSKELSEIIGFSASQIRQDFNNFGEFGQQGYGYNVVDLHREISNIIGLNKKYHIALIGVGNFGSAVAKYSFQEMGFYIDALFDNDPEKVGKTLNNVEVTDTNFLETYLSKNEIDIVAITTPAAAAQKLADRLVICGVKAIWNFAPVDLTVPEDVVVENVSLLDSLMTVSYLLNEQRDAAVQ